MTPTSPVPPNPPQGSVPSYRPVSMNWFILEAVQNSRILSVGATPVLLFTSCLTPFVELLNGATQASRSLVNFQFTRSMKNLTSAFWYSIANVPMGIIALATTPFDKGRRARDSYPDSMRPVDARSPAHLPTQVIDKATIEQELKREADLKEQVATMRSFLTAEQNTKLDRLLGYEAQFAKALEFIDIRIKELKIAADPAALEDTCNDIYQKAILFLWDLLSEQGQNHVNYCYPSGNLKAKYELVSLILSNEYRNTNIGFTWHLTNTINLIATLAGIDTIPLDSKPDQGMALFNKLVEKLSEAEKNEFQKVKGFPNQIQYLFDKLNAAALKKAGEQALIDDNMVNLRKEFAENLEKLEKTQKALDAQTELVKGTNKQLAELTQKHDAAKNRLEELEKNLPLETQELLLKIHNLEQQHTKALNDLKIDHEQAIEDLTKTIQKKQHLIDQTSTETLKFTTTIKDQKEQIETLKRQQDDQIKELNELNTQAIKALTEENARQISWLNEGHQLKIKEIEEGLSRVQKAADERGQREVDAVKTLTQQKETLQNEHNQKINELNQTHQTALKEARNKETGLTDQIAKLKLEHQKIQEKNEASFNQLHQEQENIAKANTTLQQQLDEQKKAVEESQERALQLEDKNKEQLTLIENLKKQLEDVKKVTVENPISKNLPLPTPVITSVSTAESKLKVPEAKVIPVQRSSEESPPTTPPGADVVKELAATTGISAAEKETTNPSLLLSDLLTLLNGLKLEKIGSAMSNELGYRLTPDFQKTAQDAIEKLDTNVSEFKNISENWNNILDMRSRRQKNKNSVFALSKAKFDEFVSNIRKAQQA